MALVLTDNANYAAIARSIRAKNGEETAYRPAEMAAAIDAIVIQPGRCPRTEQETVYVEPISAMTWDCAASITLLI